MAQKKKKDVWAAVSLALDYIHVYILFTVISHMCYCIVTETNIQAFHWAVFQTYTFNNR